jgi:hypothetical protein
MSFDGVYAIIFASCSATSSVPMSWRSPSPARIGVAGSVLADLSLSAWMALLAPAKTPRPIIDQLNKAVVAAFDAETRAKLAESGIEVSTSSPEEVRQLIARDMKIHAELVKAAGLMPQ